MARLHLRLGLDPARPDAPVVALVADRDGTPGERALDRLGGYCHEWDDALYLLQTDGWAERTLLEDDCLVVDVVVYPVALRHGAPDVDVTAFPCRSALDPRAVRVLRAQAVVDPQLYARAVPETAVFIAAPERTLDDVLACAEDRPMVLAPPPER
ncbi:hypothetical protein GCM10010156_31160 [Planobispora rosea]|uniref:Uncharacterized protein n=1 Tax=Planobispora rosea TaxID=35762 RepID=A0A8J3WAW2_PLARO|nr:hypothetical protein [Planobispora rosea]GGS70142.1 hypothetical protein GCM10010156_31160 [Planobispora rosea]GIH83224.1 hypothetical protein Pro02_16320 [Planobispora rosea]